MQKSLLSLLMCTLLLIACNPEEPSTIKRLRSGNHGIYLCTSDESQVKIWYTLSNGTESDVINFDTTAEWLSVTDVTNEIGSNGINGSATCVVSKNDTGAEREGQVCIVYNNQIVRVNIRQEQFPTLPEPQ